MATALAKGTTFPPVLIPELINTVRGKSSVATLCNATPIPFNGLKQFTFAMDSEISVVAESGTKPASTMSLAPIVITPFKTVYQSRVTDEFMYSSEELKINILQSFIEGYGRKLAKGLDLMAFHGVDPASGTISNKIDSYFDQDVTQTVSYAAGTTPDAAVEAAIALVQANYYDPTGIAMAPAFRKALADMTLTTGERYYPQLAWGADVQAMNGISTRSNVTVSSNPVTSGGSTVTDMAIVGDFQTAFRWGYSLEPTLEVIEYGDPDQTGVDLKAHNQIMLRSETYLGFGILDPGAFALIQQTTSS